MVIANRGKCTACGLCVRICHEHCMSLVDGVLHIDHDSCSTCTQCIAACPEQALSWDGAAPLPYDNARLPTPAQLDELFKQRRSTRFYRRKKIERALLEEIVNYGGYAPSHSHRLRAIIVDDDSIVEALDRILLRYIARMYSTLYRPKIVSSLARMVGFSQEYELARPKLVAALEKGRAFRHPPVMVFIVGEKRYALQEASAQYVLANMTYYAQVKGIGSCLWANGPMLIDRSREARRMLGIRRGEHIFGAVLLGYSAVRFKNKVEGRSIDLQWNGDGYPPNDQPVSGSAQAGGVP